jgi:uncharacterized membrane protein
MDEKLVEALDDCLDRLGRGEALEAVLSRYPESRRELEPLLRASLVTRRALAGLVPPPGARARVWTHLQPAMRVRSKRRPFLLVWLRPWAVAVTSLFLVFLLAGGTVLASGNSLPYQPLYAVKLVTEQVQLALTPTQAGKARLELALAEKRAREMVAVAQLNRPEELEKLAERLEQHLEKVAGPAVEVPPSLPSPSPSLQDVAGKTAEGIQGLGVTPPPLSPTPGAALTPEVPAALQAGPAPEVTPTPEAAPAPIYTPPEVPATPEVTPTTGLEATPQAAQAPAFAATPEATPAPEAEATPEATPPSAIAPTPERVATPEVTPGLPATPEPTPTSVPTPGAAATRTPEPTPTPEATETPEPKRTPKISASPEATATPEATPTPTPAPAPAPTLTPRPTPTPTPEVKATPEARHTPEATPTPRVTPTPRLTPTPRESATPEATPTPRVTAVPPVAPTPRAAPGPSVPPTPQAEVAKPEPGKVAKSEKPDLEARLEEGAQLQDQLLEENLDKVPPEAREALRQALEKNRDNYEKALKRLQEQRDK